MDLEEFQKSFKNVAICKIRDNFGSAFQQINLDAKNWAVIEMTVTNFHEELFLTVSQKEKRHSTSSLDYTFVKLILTRKDTQLKYIGSK